MKTLKCGPSLIISERVRMYLCLSMSRSLKAASVCLATVLDEGWELGSHLGSGGRKDVEGDEGDEGFSTSWEQGEKSEHADDNIVVSHPEGNGILFAQPSPHA